MALRKPLRSAAATALRGAEATGLFDWLERDEPERRRVLRILMYHRIAALDDRSLHPGLISASPDAFARQMRWLASRYRFVSLAEVLHCQRSASALPPRAVLLSFDDAYADFASQARPVLAELGIPAVLFVPTAFPDRPQRQFWWDRLFRALDGSDQSACQCTPLGRIELGDAASRSRAFRRLREVVLSLPHERGMQLVETVVAELGESPAPNPVLGWDALRALARDGVDLCPHTRTHPALDRISRQAVREEVEGSLEDLRREIGAVLPVFAYPGGRLDAEAVRVLGEVGIELAFTTRRGVNDLDRAHPLLLRRVPVTPRATDPVLRAQLMGWTAAWYRNAPAP